MLWRWPINLLSKKEWKKQVKPTTPIQYASVIWFVFRVAIASLQRSITKKKPDWSFDLVLFDYGCWNYTFVDSFIECLMFFQLCSLLSVEQLIEFEGVVQSLLNMCFLWCLVFDPHLLGRANHGREGWRCWYFCRVTGWVIPTGSCQINTGFLLPFFKKLNMLHIWNGYIVMHCVIMDRTVVNVG